MSSCVRSIALGCAICLIAAAPASAQRNGTVMSTTSVLPGDPAMGEAAWTLGTMKLVATRARGGSIAARIVAEIVARRGFVAQIALSPCTVRAKLPAYDPNQPPPSRTEGGGWAVEDVGDVAWRTVRLQAGTNHFNLTSRVSSYDPGIAQSRRWTDCVTATVWDMAEDDLAALSAAPQIAQRVGSNVFGELTAVLSKTALSGAVI
jgi:hypothetical protein